MVIELLCTVRGCHQPLTRHAQQLRCPRRHGFDVARSGYANLLQPQDRRSKQPGDTPAAVVARRRLFDRGLLHPLRDAVAAALPLAANDILLDIGCGTGDYLGTLTQAAGCIGSGIDLSVSAIDAAARLYPQCLWVVANADRFLPYPNHTFSAALCITARMNAPEIRRVLHPGGRLLVAVPAPDDLMELRGAGRDRIARTQESFAPHFAFAGHRRATTSADLDQQAVEDVLHAIYRPLQAQPPRAQPVTFSLDLLLFHPL